MASNSAGRRGGAFRLLLFLSLIGAASARNAHCSPDPPEKSGVTAPATPEANEALLPPASRHAFLAVKPEWIKQIHYLKRENHETMREVQANGPSLATEQCYKEVVYLQRGEKGAPPTIVKEILYDPQGAAKTEIDRVDGEQFDRTFYADGVVGTYNHLKDGKWVAGYSISPDKKTVTRIVDGTGEEILWENDKGDFIHTWFNAGVAYMARKYEANVCYNTVLQLPEQDILNITPKDEHLVITTKLEFWTWKPNAIPASQPMNGASSTAAGQTPNKAPTVADAIHLRVLERYYPQRTRVQHNETAAEKAQIVKDYATRRADLIRRFDAFLTRIGQTWEKLGIAWIQSGPGQPETPAKDPAPK